MSTPTVPGAEVVKTTRGRKPGTKAKERAEIPADQFKFEKVAPESRGYLRRQRVERSKQQEALDRLVMTVFQDWEAAGKPKNWPDMPVIGWTIGKQFEEDSVFMLHKAANLHAKKVVIGKIQRKALPGLPLNDGEIRIPFCVVARRVKVEGLPEGSESE